MITCTDEYLCRRDWEWLEWEEFEKQVAKCINRGWMLPPDFGLPWVWIKGKKYRVRNRPGAVIRIWP